MRGLVGLEKQDKSKTQHVMEDEDIWCLNQHEEDLGCDRKTLARVELQGEGYDFQVRGII